MISKISGKQLLYILLLFIFVLTIYLLFPLKCRLNYGHGQDANENSWWLERDLCVYRLKDVLYPFLGVSFYKIWKIFGWQKGGMFPLQVISAIFGAGGVIIFFFLVKTIFRSKGMSFIASIFLAFSYAYWYFSIEATNTIPSLFFLFSAVLLLFRSPEDDVLKFPIYISIFHSMSMFIDVLSFLTVPAMAYGIFLFTKGKKRRKIIRALIYLITFGLISTSIHFYMGYRYFRIINLSGMFNQLTGHTVTEVNGNRLMLGLGTLFHSLFAISHPDLISSNLYRLSQRINMVLLFIPAAGIPYVLFRIRKFQGYMVNIILFSLFWIIVPLPFYIHEEPTCLEYYVYLLPFIWLIILIAFWDIKRRLSSYKFQNILIYSIVVILAMFIIYNFSIGIRPKSEIKNNEAYKEYMFLKRHVNDKDLLIILEGSGSIGLALCYLDKNLEKLTEHIVFVDTFEALACYDSIAKRTKPDLPVYYEELCLKRNGESYYGPSFFEWLIKKAENFDDIKICIIPGKLWDKIAVDEAKNLKVSNIISDIAKITQGLQRENELVQKFLNIMSHNYTVELIPVEESFSLNSTLLSLSRRR